MFRITPRIAVQLYTNAVGGPALSCLPYIPQYAPEVFLDTNASLPRSDIRSMKAGLAVLVSLFIAVGVIQINVCM